MGLTWLADAVLFVHVLFVLFVVGGFALILVGARRWGWVRNRAFRIAHLAAIVFVTIETLLGFTCPLTLWEDVLRSTGREGRSLIGRWLAWLGIIAAVVLLAIQATFVGELGIPAVLIWTVAASVAIWRSPATVSRAAH